MKRRRLIFDAGDRIVHPKHGAGIVSGIRTIERNGKKRRYLCVELNDRYNGTLMIPHDKLEELDIRDAMLNLDLLREVMLEEPQQLHEHHRTRQAELEAKIKSNQPRKLAQALRDLVWKEHIHKLTTTDRRLKKRAQKKLVKELSLNPSLTMAKARAYLMELIQKVIQHHSRQHDTPVD